MYAPLDIFKKDARVIFLLRTKLEIIAGLIIDPQICHGKKKSFIFKDTDVVKFFRLTTIIYVYV